MIEISKAVIQKNGKFLLLKRASHSKSYPNMWDFAGGKHDAGETPEQSVIREVKEETAFDLDPGPEVKTIHYQDEQFDLLFHYFIPKNISGSLKISPDHSEYKWFTKKEVNFLKLHPAVKEYFK
ncbi:MAG: NUDIX domain-containing protein [Patescibacteria group bacterium]